jgi:protein-L-isoaspartate(D-aspartate) O-methyltransferase
LDVKEGNKVLEIGTGSGYQTAILCEMGAEVYSVERIKQLCENARKILNDLKCNIHLKLDDGTLGWKEFAPYDRIIVTRGSPLKYPNIYLTSLRLAELLLSPVGSKENQRLYVGTKAEQGIKFDKYDYFRFVPLIGEEGWSNNE